MNDIYATGFVVSRVRAWHPVVAEREEEKADDSVSGLCVYRAEASG
jgi:hypothetical protein